MQKSYPSKILNRTPFHYETVFGYNTKDRIEFFYTNKLATENLYIGEVDKSYIDIDDSNKLSNQINQYFVRKQFLNENIFENFQFRAFPKICWLTDSFMKSGFKYPVSVCYNASEKKNILNRGSNRMQVLSLFQNSPVFNCLYFNTGGVEFDFMKSLRLFGKDELSSYKENLEIELVNESNSIVPRINLDANSLKPNVLIWQNFIRKRLASQTFTIYSNIHMEMFAPWYTSEDEARIKIYIKDYRPWADIVCKCAILAVLGKSYDSDSLTVISEDSFETPS
jgi:hypothetical protein